MENLRGPSDFLTNQNDSLSKGKAWHMQSSSLRA